MGCPAAVAGWAPGGSDGLSRDRHRWGASDGRRAGDSWDVCCYLEFCDDGTVHISKDLVAHRKDAGDWWVRYLNPITDRTSGRVVTYLVRPRRQDPPTARLVFVLDVVGSRYAGDAGGWLLAGLEAGRFSAVG